MNQRLVIIQPITPRSPLALVVVWMPSIYAWTRKNFTYTPLSLIFRHAPGAKSRTMPPINYFSRDGETVVIAPRINLTIQWAERLRSLLGLGHPSFQRSHGEGSGTLATTYPTTEKKRLILTTTIDRQERIKNGRAFSIPSVLLRRYPSIIDALVQSEKKWIRGERLHSSIPGSYGLRLMSIDPVQHPIRTQLGHGQLSLQRSHSEASETLAIPHLITKSNCVGLTTKIEQQVCKESGQTFSIPSVMLRRYPPIIGALVQWEQNWIREQASLLSIPGTDGLRLKSLDPAQHPKQLLPTLSMRSVVSKSEMIAIRSPIPQDPDIIHTTLSVSTLREKQAVKSNPADVSMRDLKSVTSKNLVHGSTNSIYSNTRVGEDVKFTGHRNRREASMPSQHQHRQEQTMIPTSALHFPRKPLRASVEFKSNFFERIRVSEFQSMVRGRTWIADYQFLTKTGRGTTTQSADSLVQRSTGAFDQYSSREGSPTDRYVAFQARSTAYSPYKSWRTEGLPVNLIDKQPKGRRQPDAEYERRMSSAEVVYRTEKTPSPPPSVTIPSTPASVPAPSSQIDIDRLSRDVWRQLEKRIRIERERHGLL